MKKSFCFLLCIIFLAMSQLKAQQHKELENLWKETDTLLIKDRQPRSALQKLAKIEQLAKAQGLKDESVKILFYRLAIENQIEDQEAQMPFSTIDSQIIATKDPVETSMLQMLKINFLIKYYQQNRYQINGRIQTNLPVATDLSTWSAKDFDLTIHQLFSKALVPAKQLQKIPTTDYGAIIQKGTVPLLRPTLYDLVIHEAIDYYKSQPVSSPVSEHPYALLDTASLLPATDFANHTFQGPMDQDSLSAPWLALGYFQEAVRFHLKDSDPAALLDIDLERLQWCYGQLGEAGVVASSIDRQYLDALGQIMSRYPALQATMAAYLKARYYSDKAATYKPLEDTLHRYANKEALAIINQYYPESGDNQHKVINDIQAKSEGEAGLLNLRNNILAPSSAITVEEVNIPDQPMRALLSFKNISRLYFRVVQVPVAPGGLMTTDDDWVRLLQLPAIKSFEQDLPFTGDYQLHRTEIKIPALPTGAYVLLCSRQAGFEKTAGLSATGFSVSRMAYLKYGQDLFVLNREKGTPIAGATVDFYNQQWQDKAYVYQKGLSLVADKDGAVKVEKALEDQNNNFQHLMIIKGSDSLSTQSSFYRVYSPENITKEKSTIDRISFFTDRSIYRPGQKLYFKGIAMRTYMDGKKSSLLTDQAPQSIYLYDANGQKVDSVVLKLNSYGSLSGSFQLPEGQLTGNFSLRAETLEGNQRFKVENYKRPTFFVTLDTLSGVYQLGDSVTIHGTATAYAGNPVSSAQVNLNVGRSSIFPYPWRLIGGYIPGNRSSDQIAHGTVLTDEEGRFAFTFLAKEGSRQELDNMANFRFNIEAVCTDNNGETREGKLDMVIGSQPFTIHLTVPNSTTDKLLDALNLQTRNASGNFVAQQVTLKITPLEAPQKLIRKRLWDQPDVFVMDKDAFEKWFPLDEYGDDLDKGSWPRKAEAYHQVIQTTAKGIVKLGQQLEPGWYLIEASAPGKDQQVIKDQTFVYLYQEDKPLNGAPVYQWQDTLNTYVTAGKTASLQIASSAEDVYLVQALTNKKEGKTVTVFGKQALQNHKATLQYTLKPEDQAGARLNYAFIRDNRVYTGDMRVHPKMEQDPLSVEYKTFRDKTAPGAQEQWTVNIQSHGKSLKDVELLSGMYDGSLDQFQQQQWYFPSIYFNSYLSSDSWIGADNFSTSNSRDNGFGSFSPYYSFNKAYDDFIFRQSPVPFSPGRIMIRGAGTLTYRKTALNSAVAAPVADRAVVQDLVANVQVEQNATGVIVEKSEQIQQQPLRTDFKETAFFFPQLHSDSEGNFVLNFKMPDALTTWKWMNLAYDKDLRHVTDVKSIISQKTLMVQPNLPRFLRAGDQMQITAKISNLHTGPLAGKAELALTDPVTGKVLQNWSPAMTTDFKVDAGQSVSVGFPVKVPGDFTGPVEIVVRAAAGNFSDGEQNSLPVLSDKMLVTETVPLYMPADGSADFEMKKLLQQNSQDEPSIEPKALVFEYNTNPVWYAITALPYLVDYPYEGAEQLFNKYYANALGAYIVKGNPAIEATFQQWARDSSSILASNLAGNQDLKSVLLQQTPWVMEAQTEAAQKKALATFFKKDQLKDQMASMLARLGQLQMPDGGFSWFRGGQSDLYITQYIVSSIGRLQSLGIDMEGSGNGSLADVADKANGYIVNEYKRKYQELLTLQKQKRQDLKDYQVSPADIQYLYARSFFTTREKLNDGERFYLQQEQKSWQANSVYLKAMIAATQYRMGDAAFAKDKIMNSLIQTAVMSPDKGMYWKTSVDGPSYEWFHAPVETQAMVIGVMQEMQQKEGEAKWPDYIQQLQHWLIGNKQTSHWPSTRSTADACFALIEANKNLTAASRSISVRLGDLVLETSPQEAGTGYFKRVIAADQIRPEMGAVKIKITSTDKTVSSPSYGGLYFQYLEDIDKVTASDTKNQGLRITKQLFIERSTDQGKKLYPVTDKDALMVGDKLVVRLTLKADRGMDYVHLQDMRAAGVEPDNVLSTYKWQDGLGYYETTKDVTTDFFFNHLPEGTFVFDYPVHVTHTGHYAAGTATLECMYAPEFAAHSAGFTIDVKK